MSILNYGSLNIDHVYQVHHLVREGETIESTSYHTFNGGKGLNQSIALSLAGMNVYHAGKVGRDGQGLIEELQHHHVDVNNVVMDNTGVSGHAVIQVDEQGRNSIILHSGANHNTTKEEIDNALTCVKEGEFVLIQNEINNIEYIIRQAHALNRKVVFNPAPFTKSVRRLPLDLVSVIIVNEHEGKDLTQETQPEAIVQALYQLYHIETIVLTLGENGSMLRTNNTIYRQPAITDIQVVDTTAAGDTFIGYLLYAMTHKYSPEQSLQLATIASSYCISHIGASCSIPSMNDLDWER